MTTPVTPPRGVTTGKAPTCRLTSMLATSLIGVDGVTVIGPAVMTSRT